MIRLLQLLLYKLLSLFFSYFNYVFFVFCSVLFVLTVVFVLGGWARSYITLFHPTQIENYHLFCCCYCFRIHCLFSSFVFLWNSWCLSTHYFCNYDDIYLRGVLWFLYSYILSDTNIKLSMRLVLLMIYSVSAAVDDLNSIFSFILHCFKWHGECCLLHFFLSCSYVCLGRIGWLL